MNELRDATTEEMKQVDGGLWMQFLDNWIGAMTGGTCGYGSNGFEGPYQTAYKNPKSAPGGP